MENMLSLKKLSINILEKGVPDSIISELIENCPKTVFISSEQTNEKYIIKYINSLEKYYVQKISTRETTEEKSSPDLLMTFEGTLAFTEIFCKFEKNKRPKIHAFKKKSPIRDREELIQALNLLRGTYEKF